MPFPRITGRNVISSYAAIPYFLQFSVYATATSYGDHYRKTRESFVWEHRAFPRRKAEKIAKLRARLSPRLHMTRYLIFLVYDFNGFNGRLALLRASGAFERIGTWNRDMQHVPCIIRNVRKSDGSRLDGVSDDA